MNKTQEKKENKENKENKPTFEATTKKEMFSKKDFESTQSVLLHKKFRELEEENEKIKLLYEQTKEMNVSLSNLIKKREEVQRNLEAKFEDIYRNIANTKSFVIDEGKRVNSTLLAFESKFESNLKDSEQKLDEKVIDFSNQLNTRIDGIEEKAKEMQIQMDKDREATKAEYENAFNRFNARLEEIDNTIAIETKERKEVDLEIEQKINDKAEVLHAALDKETKDRLYNSTVMKNEFWAELEGQKEYNEKMHDKIKTEFNHVTTNLQKEMQNRLAQQDDVIDNISSVVKTIQNTLDILGKI